MFKTSQTTKKIFGAIMKAKKNFKTVVKDAANPYFNSKYETLNGVLEAVETSLNNEGVILLQPSSSDGTSNFVTTRLQHVESEEFVESTLKLELGKTTMQEVGSAGTYARRQTLKGLLGLQSEDDDGNVASGKKVETAPPQAKKSPGRPAKTTNELPPVVVNGKSTAPEITEDEW